MQKILITGNGFDLSLGLPTSFTDFISILKNIDENDSFNDIYEKSSLFETLKENFNEFEINSDKIKSINEKATKNKWFNYLKGEHEIDSWIDFEEKLEYTLYNIFQFIQKVREVISARGSVNKKLILSKKEIDLNNIEHINTFKSFDLIIELDYGRNVEFNSEFLRRRHAQYIGVNIQKLTLYLLEELNKFKELFCEYIETFIDPFYDHKKNDLEKLPFDKVDKHFTFNYTPSFSEIYTKGIETDFVHGDIKNKNIVMGVPKTPDDNIDYKYYIPFTKYYQKLNSDTDYTFLSKYKDNEIDDFIFYFFGHSLSSSDADYINEIFEFINKASVNNKHYIYVFYHDQLAKAEMLINLIDVRDHKEIQRLMKEGTLKFISIDSEELINVFNVYGDNLSNKFI
ncbi:AbiH family protein [Salibacter halophilus]|uniref:Bacteriophage abortive infection AbiH n=1 Tax=Salibacter halophilus TaxID=1803916 RepID=A0A6N6M6P4_9FLAO|nr:AbiH family protein [Salibacter halophilus]KAB1065582.1 hypothetical protein F3059_02710 [Salibacter halophilus]